MGWFNKKEDKKEEVPRLPELPKLPELPPIKSPEDLPQLPSFPSSSIGDKFSQNAIRDAVTGKEEGDKEVDAEELDDMRMMPPQNIPMSKDIDSVPYEFKEAAHMVKKSEPVFVRIDKFEKALDIFEKAKEKITDIEKMLKDIKKLKEQEQEELDGWEKEIQTTKQQIERVDKELFSKIE